MNKKLTSAPKKSLNSQSKDKEFNTQLNKVYHVFYEQPLTMKEADFYSGVMRESICRHVKTLRNENKIFLIGKKICEITKRCVGSYTTNPELIPSNNQTNLFD